MARLKFFARPHNGAKPVIAVEFADDPDHAIDGLKIRSSCGGVHRAVSYEQRLVEAADLKREELGWGLRHTLSEDLANEIAHPLERKTLLRGNLWDRNAPIEEADDALLALGLFQAGGSSYP
jgi:hypothetical protein